MLIRWWWSSLVTTVSLSLASYLWIDRSLARFIHEHVVATRARELTAPFADAPDPLVLAALALFLAFGLLAIRRPDLVKIWQPGSAIAVSVLVGEIAKGIAKWVFGRPWPESWRMQYPSYLRDGDYRFHWFEGGGTYGSFPSGHMTAACAFLSVVYIAFPRLRSLCVVTAVGTAGVLVGTNYHFLSDVISGSFLGVTVGCISWAITRAPSRYGADACRTIRDKPGS